MFEAEVSASLSTHISRILHLEVHRYKEQWEWPHIMIHAHVNQFETARFSTPLIKAIRNEASKHTWLLKQHCTATPLQILLIVVANEISKLPQSLKHFFLHFIILLKKSYTTKLKQVMEEAVVLNTASEM